MFISTQYALTRFHPHVIHSAVMAGVYTHNLTDTSSSIFDSATHERKRGRENSRRRVAALIAEPPQVQFRSKRSHSSDWRGPGLHSDTFQCIPRGTHLKWVPLIFWHDVKLHQEETIKVFCVHLSPSCFLSLSLPTYAYYIYVYKHVHSSFPLWLWIHRWM